MVTIVLFVTINHSMNSLYITYNLRSANVITYSADIANHIKHYNVTIGYHQKCHETKILQRALEDDSIWICYFCEQEMACPYVTNADVLTQSLEGIDNQTNKHEKLKSKKVSNSTF